MPVDVAFRGSELGAGAGLDLNHDQGAALARNDIEFSGTRWRAEIARYDGHTEILQIAVGEILGMPAKGMVGGPGLAAEVVPQAVGDAVQPSKHELLCVLAALRETHLS